VSGIVEDFRKDKIKISLGKLSRAETDIGGEGSENPTHSAPQRGGEERRDGQVY
tara:strand:+ start:415 stop:576 length:162 start_codon:yes stop_codon:yes gene_type:complete